MNCTKCGTPLQSEDRFCYYCGMPIEQATPAASSTTQPNSAIPPLEQSIPVTPPMPEPLENPLFGNPVPLQSSFQPTGTQCVGVVSHERKLSGRTFFGILSIVVGCLLIIGIVICLFAGGSYKSALKEMWHKAEQQDTDGVVACMFPEEAEGQISAAAARIEPYIQDLHTRAETRYGENYHIRVKFDDMDMLDAAEQEQFDVWFENLALKKEVKKVYAVEYTLSIKGAKGRESEDYECYIYRYDGNWYVLDTDLLGLQNPL